MLSLLHTLQIDKVRENTRKEFYHDKDDDDDKKDNNNNNNNNNNNKIEVMVTSHYILKVSTILPSSVNPCCNVPIAGSDDMIPIKRWNISDMT